MSELNFLRKIIQFFFTFYKIYEVLWENSQDREKSNPDLEFSKNEIFIKTLISFYYITNSKVELQWYFREMNDLSYQIIK